MGSPGGGDLLRARLCSERMAAADLDPARALADLRALRELTEDDRGAQRVAWTDTWAQARAWLGGRRRGGGGGGRRPAAAAAPAPPPGGGPDTLGAVLRGARPETVVL